MVVGADKRTRKRGKRSRVAVMPACHLCPYSRLVAFLPLQCIEPTLTHLYYTHVYTHRTMKPVCLLSLLVAGAAAFHMRK